MKILISTDTYYPHVNGCSYFGQRLAHYLQQKGHSVLVIAPSKNLHEGFFIHNDIRIFGVRAIPLPYNNFSVAMPMLSTSLRKAIESFSPDIIHFQGHFFVSKAVMRIAKRTGVPMVGTNHFMPENITHYLHLPEKVEHMLQRRLWRQFKDFFEKLHAVTSPTKTAADLAKASRLSKEITALSNGIDRKRFLPGNDTGSLAERYRLPDVPRLLYVGRLDKEKNVDLLLRAFARAAEHSDIHFVIGGNGAEKNNLIELAHTLGIAEKVTFTGFVPDEDLPNLYRIVDCFANAGTAELQSIVTMEAMASGLPVIGANAVALPELIHHDENGFLFEPGDEKAAANAIHMLLSDTDLRKRMGQKSLEIIAQHDIDLIIGRFEDLYRSAIGSANPVSR